ncbi:thiazole synthase [Shewanella mangrovi]|uniref:Thiazole synthase n=1 Tax=Shewanella mangrovi TaxID=1515746 RepID=A0A094JK01_9GAMM|nr:thiazole synthase [Shewanella mangrovi]KFZ38369.1 thiazole synthase [Shewanella mangrovi]
MLTIADTQFSSRLFTGTGKFSDADTMLDAISASDASMVTVAMKRIDFTRGNDDILKPLVKAGCKLLPNTSGARTAKEAIFAAELGREMLATEWVKVEIHPDPRYLLPDPMETFDACAELVKQGFKVLPYVHADPVLCCRLQEIGCAAVMPLGSPIGSNQGLASAPFLKIIIEQAQVPVIIDAGIGSPAQAMQAIELGADAVLVNTAIASARDPVAMAACFRDAVTVGRQAFEAGLGQVQTSASASSPLTGFLRAQGAA